jgi:hypothetical protein
MISFPFITSLAITTAGLVLLSLMFHKGVRPNPQEH